MYKFELKGDKHYNCAQENWHAPTCFQPDKMPKEKTEKQLQNQLTFNQNIFLSPQNQKIHTFAYQKYIYKYWLNLS
jgi:hypothetical protein